MRPLLENETSQAMKPAQWVLTDNTIGLKDRPIGRQASTDAKDGDAVLSKTRSELRGLDHLRRDSETVLDAVFDATTTTEQVYRRSFREIVLGSVDGLNGAILAYGQTSSGKTFSINGSSSSNGSASKLEDDPESHGQKGITQLALNDIFDRIRDRTSVADSSSAPVEFLVRMSYCELYMERVNDLLRKACPESQNLTVKEDAEQHSFYVDGLTEQVVTSPEQVLALLVQAEKRRRVAYTRYNEVSSRSHTLLTLHVESSAPMEDSDAVSPDDAPMVSKAGRLVIVDLAGNERMETGTDYMAESNSINKSLFFLGQVIEKLSTRERLNVEDQDLKQGSEHVPFRDSKLTRLLSINLGGNSQTGVLITLAPPEEYVEQSLSTLRFAQKAALVRCAAKPVFLSKEQSLIQRQREIIAELRSEVKKLKHAQKELVQTAPLPERRVAEERAVAPLVQQIVQQPPAQHTSSPKSELQHAEPEQEREKVKYCPTQGFISQSKEVDAIVTALHRSNDVLRRQKATVVDEIRELHKALTQVSADVANAASNYDGRTSPRVLFSDEKSTGKTKRPWEPAVRQLRSGIQDLLQKVVSSGDQSKRIAELEHQLHQLKAGNASGRTAVDSTTHEPSPGIASKEASAALRLHQAQVQAARTCQSPPSSSSARSRTPVGRGSLQTKKDATSPDASPSPVAAAEDTTVCGLRTEVNQLKANMAFLTEECERLRGEVERSQTSKQPSHSDESTRPPSGQSAKSVGSTASADHARLVYEGRDRVSAASPTMCLRAASPLRLSGQSVLSPSIRRECEPIVEASGRPPVSARALEKDLSECAPIVEPCGQKDPAVRKEPLPPPQPSAPGRPPPPHAELGLRAAADYYRHLGLRPGHITSGDVDARKGDTPKELGVARYLDAPEATRASSSGSKSPVASGAQEALDLSKPVRLAPLADLCVDRPASLDQPPQIASTPRTPACSSYPASAMPELLASPKGSVTALLKAVPPAAG